MDDYPATHKGISARKIYRALHPHRQHLFLKLMPFSWHAPEHFVDLQVHTYHALRSDQTPPGRTAAVMEIAALYDIACSDMPRKEFLVEVAAQALERGFTFQTAELLVWAQLSSEDVLIDEWRADPSGPGVPKLVPEKPGRILGALATMKAAFERLELLSAGDQQALAATEALAAIRLLRLYSRYHRPDETHEAQARFRFFQERAEPIWRGLILFGFGSDSAGMHGTEAAMALSALLRNKVDEEETSAHPAPAPEPIAAPRQPMHLVVSEPFPAGRDDADRNLLKEFAVLRVPMPVALLPDISELDRQRAQLTDEFPWCTNVVDAVFDELLLRRRAGALKLFFPPILLTGPAGSGKTRLARRLAEVLGIRCHSLSLAGATDSMQILGTARGWSSGQPSPLLRPLLKGCATALVALDEVDKAADSTRTSPAVENALLSLLEPEECRRWRDVFLQTECNLSTLMFVLTCNSSLWLSTALRSRLREHQVRRPTLAELMRVAKFVIADLERDLDLPAGTFSGIPIEKLLPPGMSSLRDLRKAVGAAMRHWMSQPAQAIRH
jgi:hypothetical protein